MTIAVTPRRNCAFEPLIYMTLSLLLSACGGGKGDAPMVKANTSAISLNSMPTPEQTQELFKKGAELNAAELARAADDSASEGASRKRKANAKAAPTASLVTVYRFYNSQTTAHFFTASETEKANVLALLPEFSLDGAAFYASKATATGLSPVHRFFNTQTGVHFYTISEDEKALVQAIMPQFHYDGVAYYASKVAGAEFNPLYRFLYANKGFHFFSSSETERANIVATLPQYRFEGIGYYVMTANWGLKLPHSGVTDQQCFQAGSNTLVACSSAGATALNSQQDGHRTTVNPMTYSEVPKVGRGTYARTECVKDNLTGLVWEGKAASGLRAGSNTYTHYDALTEQQRSFNGGFVNPTQAEIDASTNSVGYLNHVNSIALCGHTDWRLPTVDELQGIVDYSVADPGPTIDTDWFPNSAGTWYVSTTSFPGYNIFTYHNYWSIHFGRGSLFDFDRDEFNAVRLVRGNL